MSVSKVLGSLTSDGSGYRVTVGDDWTQGRATFGGLVAAVGNEAMRKLAPRDRCLRSLQTTFIGPAAPGTWRIDARVLRVGKAVTLVHCEILDGNQVAATQIGVYGSARPSAVIVEPEARAALRRVEEIEDMRLPDDKTFAFFQHFALRWVQGARPFSSAPNIPPSMAFVRHREAGPLTESHLVALADCIPTPAMAMYTAPAPSSSLIWTLEFFEHKFDYSPNAWWRLDTHIDAAGQGYVNQTGMLLNPDGQPAALTRQLVTVFG
jgi:acyl-CoA thioesterase